MMEKIDIKKKLANLYAPGTKTVQTVTVPKMNFIMIDGTGNPNNRAYQQAVEALYTLSYTLKFTIKKESGVEYSVMPLEGLWWAQDMPDFQKGNKDNWQWTAMIMQPEYVTEKLFRSAVDKVKADKNPPALSEARFEAFDEGLCAQIMYIGPYAEEGPIISRIHEFIADSRYQLRGKHHEIYLGDPRRSKPEKLKTILRQPMG